MSLSNGRPYLAIPGPSVLPDRVVQAMMRPSPNIYQGELVDMTATILPDLKSVARTTGHVAIYIANGHGVWEAALSNVLSRGDKILVLVTGRFGHGWAEMARGLHLDLEVMDFGQQASIDLNQVETRLKADTDHSIKAVLAVHVDTSTSIKNDIAGVRQAMDAAG
ncbi:MAG: aminotransferase class V-fold PLP-dependent enzyme, partial [Marivivens sp.]|nr:aminotransferase class V-fold PLP-dependent enzyme [Marivivens sp.]